jgi:phage terminase small subunit
MALVSAQSVYLPPENVEKFNKEVADFFIRKALKEKDDKKLQMFCLDKAFGFMFDQENL